MLLVVRGINLKGTYNGREVRYLMKKCKVMNAKKEKKQVITRRIQIRVLEQDSEKKKEFYKKLRDINEMVMRMSNTAATHMYIQKNLDDFEYIANDYKKHSAEIYNEGVGFSPQNRSYKVLSNKFREEMKGLSDIMSNLNSQLKSTFSKESKEYFTGKRSLRTYRRDVPIPFSASSITDIQLTEDKKNYIFNLFKIPFVTYFGRDYSRNKLIWERALPGGDYHLCNSSLQFSGTKLYLLAVFSFEPEQKNLDSTKIAEAMLTTDYPIVFRHKNYEYNIGDREEFYHYRNAIQGALRRQRIASKFNNGGRGRKKKLASCERFEKKEHNYVQNRQHLYSKRLVDKCVKERCGTLILRRPIELTPPEEMEGKEKKEWFEANNPVLRNWSYHGLIQKIQYKCKAAGINVIIEKPEIKDEDKKSKKNKGKKSKKSEMAEMAEII